MLSLNQLVSLTQEAKKTFKRSNYQAASLVIQTVKGGEGDFIRAKAVITGGKDPRISVIDFHSNYVVASANVRVYCTCPYFKYKVALFLASKDSTTMTIERKEIPADMLANQASGLCPHLYYLVPVVLSARNTTEGKKAASSHITPSATSRLKQLT